VEIITKQLQSVKTFKYIQNTRPTLERMVEVRNAYKILVGKQKELLGRPRCRCEDNTRIDLRK